MASFSVRASLCALFVALALVGCASDDEPSNPAGGAGGTTGGAGGAAGMMTGGMGGAAGMMTGGMGGTGGGGAGGMMGGGDTVPGCEAAVAGEPAALHAAAVDALGRSCAFGSCHNEDGNRAMLVLLTTSNLVETLVDKPACQVPSLMLVKSGGGQPALDGSWVWQKLTAPADADTNLVPNTAWGTPVICGQTQGTFGTQMPMSAGMLLGDERMGAVRNWICAGAQM